MTQAFNGSWSGRLLLPSGSLDFAKVRVPISNTTLGNGSGLFQTYVVPGSAPNLVPYMYFEVDSNQNGIFDFTGGPGGDSFVIAFITGAGPVPQGRWMTQGLNSATNIHVVGNRTGLTATQFSSSFGGGLLSALRSTTYSGATTWGNLPLIAARVGAGEWPGAGAFDAYVDDILVTRGLETPPAASDTCDPYPVITATRSPVAPMSAPFSGFTIITWKATDDCGNFSTCPQTVTVNAYNTMLVDVQLAGADPGPFTRYIRFELSSGGPGTTVVNQDVTFVSGLAMNVPVNVPCGSYSCITARDRKHTLRRTDSGLTIVGVNYDAEFTTASGDALVGGNLNDDFFIDILDFGIFVGQWALVLGPNTPCVYVGNHADISGDGTVWIEDYTFISGNFLLSHEANCPGVAGFVDDDGMAINQQPITRISVKELRRRGLGDLIKADLNHDGWLDTADMAAFLNGSRP